MIAETPLERLQEVGFALAMRDSLWLYPTVESPHMIGFVMLVGTALVFDLRVLGLSKRIPVRLLAAHTLPWSLASLALIVPTGLLMFLANATALIANKAFVLKMVLMCVGANAAAFLLGPFRAAMTWDITIRAPAAARIHAAVSLVLWILILTCGRLIAYV